MTKTVECTTPDETFAIGERVGRGLQAGSVVLLYGGLGAGKTLLTKGILASLEYDIDEVTSPSFALVNLYKTGSFNVYHIDLWRIDERVDAAHAVGLEEILEDPQAIVVIEWADRLRQTPTANQVIPVTIEGSGDEPRKIALDFGEQMNRESV